MKRKNVIIPIDIEQQWRVADSKCYCISVVGDDVVVEPFPALPTGIQEFPSHDLVFAMLSSFVRLRNLNPILRKWKLGRTQTPFTECVIVYKAKARTYLGVYAEWEKIKKRVSEDPEALNDVVDELDENRYQRP